MESETSPTRKEHPRARANPLVAVLLLHMFPIFWRFYKNEMHAEDLYDVLDEHKSNKLGDTLERLWAEEYTKNKKFALHFALFRQFGLELVAAGSLICIAEIIVLAVTPFALGNLVTYFQNGHFDTDRKDGYYYAAMLGFGLGVRIFVNHPNLMWIYHTCMKVRVACCSVIYRKSLRLSASALSQTTIGHIVNLLSNDVSKFDQGLIHAHYVLIAPIQTAFGFYLLYGVVGVSAFSGIAFLLMIVPMQIILGKVNSKMRLRIAIRTDERLRLMNEILCGISVIKMYTWELPFAKLVSMARRYEMKATRLHFYVLAIYNALQMFVTRTSIFITIVVFVSLANNVSANTVYSITAIYSILRPNVTILFSIAIAGLANVHVSLTRIQEFLSYDEIQQGVQYEIDNDSALKHNEQPEENGVKKEVHKVPIVVLKDVSVKWIKELPQDALHNISLNINTNQLVAVIGAVGSGKSTLLNVILKELPINSGTLDVSGKVSFASQEPWLFSASVRQNILFGAEYVESRYRTVIRACALESDLKMLPYGDRTIITQSGKSLSGGQKARISLARCVYRHADIYLLDDPLSAVDPNVGNHLYEKCIKGFLSDKICILITHQLQYLRNADKIFILSKGKVVGQGTYQELQNSGLDFANLLKEFHAEDEPEQPTIKPVLSRQDIELQEIINEAANKNKETVVSGSTGPETYLQYFKAGGNYCLIFTLVLAFLTSFTVATLGDYFVAYWVKLEHHAVKINGTATGTYTNTSISREIVIYVYSAIIALTIIVAVGQSVFFYIFVTRASINLHNFIFEKVTFATMQFFNENPTGRILNRFAKDIGIVDEYIPSVLMEVLNSILILIAAIIISIAINPWLLLPVAVLAVIFYYLRTLYISTSRSVKRIEGVARSPIFNHVSASISGLPTIRALGVQQTLMQEFDTHQDFHSSAWYLFFSASRAFGFWLDVVCWTFIGVVLLLLLNIDLDYGGEEIGLLITQYILLCDVLQWGLRQWCELENHITSMERVFEYTKVATDPVREPVHNLKKGWPEYGQIVFEKVSMCYINTEPPVLRNLNITINSGEKIGIVGRTGAGKSSIIAALFQLYKTSGSIIIDGVDITKVPLKDVRSKISIIPQEPVLFSGTLRKNLDPLEEYNDDLLWNALELVELKQLVEDSPGGMSTTVAEAGCNFSIGQRQLICLARAIIRNNKVLVLDEATANVDPHTDAVIQKTIRQEFEHCTVLTIAHRLHTIMDSHKVLVMDAGSAVEFDHPHNLLKSSYSRFYKMVQMTGKGASKNLHSIAEESFKHQN